MTYWTDHGNGLHTRGQWRIDDLGTPDADGNQFYLMGPTHVSLTGHKTLADAKSAVDQMEQAA